MTSKPPPLTLDRTIYLVISDHKSGPYVPEVRLADTHLVKVIKDIRDRQYTDVLRVIELNLARETCRDCTDDFSTVLEEPPEP